MKKTDLYVIGGFLGAGKTTSILALAKHLLNTGKKIGIVTNDQGSDLVDTNFLIKSGLPVLEVAGGCFCCNFDEFTKKVNELSSELMPDIILAEPVGSCTDLIATIFKPIHVNIKQFSLAPLSIVVDPRRVKKLIMEQQTSPFSSEINYLFIKQIEEADIIVLNKTDTLSQEEILSIEDFLIDRFKGIDVISLSAKNETYIGKWLELITSSTSNSTLALKPSLNIDYSTYAFAEECLGWLNSSANICSKTPHNANLFIHSFMEQVKSILYDKKIEIAHLKVYEVGENDWCKASLTSIYEDIDFNKTMENNISAANIIVNARVNTTPEILQLIITETLYSASIDFQIDIKDLQTACFKPGKPNPKFRIC